LMAFRYLRLEVLAPPTADGLNEVRKVVFRFARKRLDEIPFAIEPRTSSDQAFRPLDNPAGLELLAEGSGFETAHFLDDGCGAEGVDHHLGVRRLAGILVAESPSDAEYGIAEPIQAGHPPDDVDVVDIVVSELAVAGVPDPVPVVMQLGASQLFLKARS